VTDVPLALTRAHRRQGADIVFTPLAIPIFQAGINRWSLRVPSDPIAAATASCINLLSFLSRPAHLWHRYARPYSSIAPGRCAVNIGGLASPSGHLKPFPINGRRFYPLKHAKAAFLSR